MAAFEPRIVKVRVPREQTETVLGDKNRIAVALPRLIENRGHLTLGHRLVGGVFDRPDVPPFVHRSNRADECGGCAMFRRGDLATQGVDIEGTGYESRSHLASGNWRNQGYLIATGQNCMERRIYMIYRNERARGKLIGSG